MVLRLRVVFMPNRPQHDAGMRIEPPPSLAWASGTMRAATAAAEPPLEPPAVRVRSQGFRVGPNSTGSVVALRPNSGVLVRPRIIRPARLCRVTISASAGAGALAKKREPPDSGTPASAPPRSLSRNGTPANGASRSSAAASPRAWS